MIEPPSLSVQFFSIFHQLLSANSFLSHFHSQLLSHIVNKESAGLLSWLIYCVWWSPQMKALRDEGIGRIEDTVCLCIRADGETDQVQNQPQTQDTIIPVLTLSQVCGISLIRWIILLHGIGHVHLSLSQFVESVSLCFEGCSQVFLLTVLLWWWWFKCALEELYTNITFD